MPMNRRLLGQRIREMDDQPITDMRMNQRAWQLAVIGPGLSHLPRDDRDGRDLSTQIDLDDGRIGVDIGRFRQLQVGIPAIGLQGLGASGQSDADKAENTQEDKPNGLSKRHHARHAGRRMNGAHI